VLVVTDDPRGVPIVRTTTAYTLPAQCFRPIHTALARQIRACASLAIPFNNALLEVYTRAYTTMGAHSDQALDLDDAGEIALFSCYEHPEAGPSRRLMVESKEPGGPSFAIPLVPRPRRRVLRRHQSQVPPPDRAGPRDRSSRQPLARGHVSHLEDLVHLRDGQPRLADGAPLTLASDEERREFLRLRRRENQETDFVYPRVTCTLSPSDLWPPEVFTAPGSSAGRW
jgi:hypothetical protein